MVNTVHGIRGTAKTYSGGVVKYIRVFKWGTGELNDIIYPSQIDGAWSYDPVLDISVGLTYIADNVRPYTNGPYAVDGVYGSTPMEGFLLIAWYSNTPNPSLDVTAINEPTWPAYFEQVESVGLFNYRYGGTIKNVPLMTKTINMFSSMWNMQIYGWNGSGTGDSHMWTMEFMTSTDEVICAVKSIYGSTYSSNLFYGKNLSTLVQTGRNGTYTATGGILSFTDTSISFKNTRSSQYNMDFTFAFDVLKVDKIRVSGNANSDSYNAGGYIRLVKVIV